MSGPRRRKPAPQLHLAAMPFPSPQGTQAALGHMLEALRGAGHPAHLLTYPHGDGRLVPVPVSRLWPLPPVRSLRSGPSLGKLLLDAQMLLRLRRLVRRLSPRWIVAHHVEAAAAAALGAGRPFAFFAHTALGPELPLYLSPRLAPMLRLAGDRMDRWLLRRAKIRMALSPLLVSRLEALSEREVLLLPVPWPLPPRPRPDAHEAARHALGLEPHDEVVLYAGNLDGYQGLETLLDAMARLARRRPRLRWLVATACRPAPLLRAAARAGLLARIRIAPLDGEAARRRAHAAADVAVIPRRAPGGMPVKLLDAMARAVPTVATRRATAGFPLDDVVHVAPDDSPLALAAVLREALEAPPQRRAALGSAARDHVATEHAPKRFVQRLDAALGVT